MDKKPERLVPEVRFKGFTDDWEQRKLSKVKDVRDGTHDSPKYHEKGFPLITSKNLTPSGVDFSDASLIDEHDYQEINKRSLVEIHDILFGMIGTIGNPVIVKKSGFAIKNVALIKHGGNLSNYFLLNLLNSPIFAKYINKENAGGTQKFLSLSIIRNFRFLAPGSDEQNKIGNMFEQVDTFITLQQRKLEQLKQLKTAMLQQLFVNKNYKQPILRFKNFNGNWEKRKFSELATIRRGLTYKPKDVRECGKNSKRVLRSSNINENSFVIYNDDVFVDKSSINIAYVHNNDILITAANGSSKLVGKHALIHDIPDNSAVHGGFMLLASSNNPEFINALMSSPWYSRFVNNYVIGGNGAIGNLKKDDLDSQIIYTPIKNEIKKIGHFFNRLDNLIALQQNKLTQLTTLKKYLLQKLFI